MVSLVHVDLVHDAPAADDGRDGAADAHSITHRATMTAATAAYGAARQATPSARVRKGGRDGAGTAAQVGDWRDGWHALFVQPLTPQ